jgi:catechol 2,3-dioxygenase-like lactoylglutathione lyase family enzyme
MTRILRAATALLLYASVAIGPCARGDATPSPTLLRTALLVSDADRSIAFYGLLGFSVEADSASDRKPEASPFPLNAPSTRYRLVILASGDRAGGRIGLVDFRDPAPASSRAAGAAGADKVGRGDMVFVFDVADADAVHAALQNSGARILEAPQIYISRRKAADGRSLQGKVFHAWDPDGNLIELLEAPK